MKKKAILLLLCLVGCHRPFTDHVACLGADDLIMDSYALKEETQHPPSSQPTVVTVTGAVKRRTEIPLQTLSAPLRDVLQEAGGLTTFGSPNQIFIFREGANGVRIYAVTWEHLVTLPKQSLLARQGDIICVGTKPLFRWVNLSHWDRFLGENNGQR